jgi:hypothetical protein
MVSRKAQFILVILNFQRIGFLKFLNPDAHRNMFANGHSTRTSQENGALNESPSNASSELPKQDHSLNTSRAPKNATRSSLAEQGLVKSAKSEGATASKATTDMKKHSDQEKHGQKTPRTRIGFWPITFFSELSRKHEAGAAGPSWMFHTHWRRRSVTKPQAKNKKSILITPQRRYELDRLLAFRKRKRQRVHFFIPQNKRVVFLRMMEPNSKTVQRWLALMVLPLVYEAWSLPYRLALEVPSISSGLLVADMVVDSLMVVRVQLAVHHDELES